MYRHQHGEMKGFIYKGLFLKREKMPEGRVHVCFSESSGSYSETSEYGTPLRHRQCPLFGVNFIHLSVIMGQNQVSFVERCPFF